MSSPSLFSDVQPNNPYASPAAASNGAGNRLFVPALILLVLDIPWTLYVLVGCIMVFSPRGPFSAMDPTVRATTMASYCLMVATNIVFISGAVAMIRMRPKWLAWTGCILGLVPIFGPCFGFTIPLAFWCLMLLRRPDINSRISS